MAIDTTAFDAMMAAKESAYWAGSSAAAAWLVGLIGLTVNAVGLFVLREQLKTSTAATRMAAEAVRLAAAEGRPWIGLGVSKVEVFNTQPVGRPETTSVLVTFEMTNLGKTPALNCFAGLIFFKGPVIGFDRVKAEAHPLIGLGRTVFPNKAVEVSRAFDVPSEMAEEGTWKAVVYAQYQAAGQPDCSLTPALFLLAAQSVIETGHRPNGQPFTRSSGSWTEVPHNLPTT